MKNINEVDAVEHKPSLSFVVTVITPHHGDDGCDVTAWPYWEVTGEQQRTAISKAVAAHCSQYGRGDVTVSVEQIAC